MVTHLKKMSEFISERVLWNLNSLARPNFVLIHSVGYVLHRTNDNIAIFTGPTTEQF